MTSKLDRHTIGFSVKCDRTMSNRERLIRELNNQGDLTNQVHNKAATNAVTTTGNLRVRAQSRGQIDIRENGN